LALFNIKFNIKFSDWLIQAPIAVSSFPDIPKSSKFENSNNGRKQFCFTENETFRL